MLSMLVFVTYILTDLFYISGYSGFVPNIKCENVFGESYGKTTGASVGSQIPQGFVQSPDEKFKSMNQTKFTN